MWILLLRLAPKRRVHRARNGNFRPHMETLEDRYCPSPATFEWSDPTGGALDPAFGSGGQVLTSFSNYYDSANAVTTQPDGKIVIAGLTASSGSKTGDDFLVARYTANGTLDAAFGSNGHTTTNFGSAFDRADAVALQPQADGTSKVLAAGSTMSAQGKDEFALARYTAGGALDTAFGSKGKVVTYLGGTVTFAQSMVVDSSGRILVAGYTNATGTTTAALVRYTANGALDTTFGSGGKLVTNLQVKSGYGLSAALQADGKIVVASNMLDPATSAQELVVARYNANGSADAGFGTGGVVKSHPGTTDDYGGLAIQRDGKIVVSGSENSSSPSALYLLRYNPDGSPDATFGAGGLVALASPGGPADGSINADGIGIAIQADGEILAGGEFYNTTAQQENLAVARTNPNGGLDPGFGNRGWATIQFASNDAVRALSLQPDGRVLLAGEARPTSATYPTDVALVRFLASAPQIGSFTANPNPVPSGSSTTLTASNLTDYNPGATVSQVAFYIMVNGSGVLLGYGTQNSDGSWSYAFDTTGYASGTYTLFAQATDSDGVLGNPVALTLTIQ